MWRVIRKALTLAFASMGTTMLAIGTGLVVSAVLLAIKFRDKGCAGVKTALAGDAGVGVAIAGGIWVLLFIFSFGRAKELQAKTERPRIHAVFDWKGSFLDGCWDRPFTLRNDS